MMDIETSQHLSLMIIISLFFSTASSLKWPTYRVVVTFCVCDFLRLTQFYMIFAFPCHLVRLVRVQHSLVLFQHRRNETWNTCAHPTRLMDMFELFFNCFNQQLADKIVRKKSTSIRDNCTGNFAIFLRFELLYRGFSMFVTTFPNNGGLGFTSLYWFQTLLSFFSHLHTSWPYYYRETSSVLNMSFMNN